MRFRTNSISNNGQDGPQNELAHPWTNTHTQRREHRGLIMQNSPFQNNIYYWIIITDAFMLQLVNTELYIYILYIWPYVVFPTGWEFTCGGGWHSMWQHSVRRCSVWQHCFVSVISTIMHIIILFKIIQLCLQWYIEGDNSCMSTHTALWFSW